MARWMNLAVAGAFVVFGGPALAQQPTFRGGIELVMLNVTVTGPKANPVPGLKEGQFQVFEDGIAQKLAFFDPGELPVDVIVLIDASSSMTGSMGFIQQAASRFVHALRPVDRVAVAAISNGLRIIQPFTSDHAVLDAAIRSTRPRGRTPLYASLYTALDELARLRRATPAPRRQAIVMLSDGRDTASPFGFDELLPTVRRHAVPIYAITPRAPESVRALHEAAFGETTVEQDYELRALASETGGRAFFPTALRDLAGVYEAIARELAHQYSLGYHSSNPAPGGFRRIALRVLAPNVTWRTRAGYVAAPGGPDAGPGAP
jgi:Ca-activated chloride channel family protein